MSTLWSSKIQGIKQLDVSREWRYRDDKKDALLPMLGFQPGMTVVDLGCGPGTLPRKFAQWLGESTKVIGVDLDTTFLEYARAKASQLGLTNLTYYEGNALQVPLEDNSVDACTSHSVIEHVPNREFLLEQQRICRPGGRVSVMSVRPEKAIISNPVELNLSKREEELWGMLTPVLKEAKQEYQIAAHEITFDGLPKLFDELGFKDVRVDAIALPVVPDDARNSLEEKLAMVQLEKEEILETLEIVVNLHKEPVEEQIVRELKELVDARYAKRLEMVKAGVNVWNYEISIVLIVSGVVA